MNPVNGLTREIIPSDLKHNDLTVKITVTASVENVCTHIFFLFHLIVTCLDNKYYLDFTEEETVAQKT